MTSYEERHAIDTAALQARRDANLAKAKIELREAALEGYSTGEARQMPGKFPCMSDLTDKEAHEVSQAVFTAILLQPQTNFN